MPAEYSPGDLNGIFIDFPSSAAGTGVRAVVLKCLAQREKAHSLRLPDLDAHLAFRVFSLNKACRNA
jgi:hypothetical protein